MPKSGALLPILFAASIVCGPARAAGTTKADAKTAVDGVVAPLMAQQHIPGMAVGVLVDGRAYVFNYGVASLATRRPVTDRTLFEIGSISKTFTATLAALACMQGTLAFDDPVERYLPALAGTAFGRATLLELATHTTGGLPLQVPDAVHGQAALIAWLRAWQPACTPGTCRAYTNIGIGMLGVAAATRAGQPFTALMQHAVLDPLGLNDTWYHVPATQRANYARGYTSDGKPIRVAPGVLDMEAYGVRTTARDLLRFVAANVRASPNGDALQRAIAATHAGYFEAGPLQQDLIWGAVRVARRVANAMGRQQSPNALRSSTRRTPFAAGATAAAGVDQQDRLDERLCCVCGVHSRSEPGHRAAGQPELSDRRPRDGGLPHPVGIGRPCASGGTGRFE
jgi:beta-lactamase class C